MLTLEELWELEERAESLCDDIERARARGVAGIEPDSLGTAAVNLRVLAKRAAALATACEGARLLGELRAVGVLP